MFFPRYCTFNGTFTSCYLITDTYHVFIEDGDEETDSHDHIQKYIEGTPEYEQAHDTALTLTASLATTIWISNTPPP